MRLNWQEIFNGTHFWRICIMGGPERSRIMIITLCKQIPTDENTD